MQRYKKGIGGFTMISSRNRRILAGVLSATIILSSMGATAVTTYAATPTVSISADADADAEVMTATVTREYAASTSSKTDTSNGNFFKDVWEVITGNTEEQAKQMLENFTYTTSGKSITITGLSDKGKKQKQLTIPGTVDGKTVTKIADGAFKNSTASMTSIRLPKTLTSVGNEAFYGCKKLKTVSVDTDFFSDKENKTITFGKSAFENAGLTEFSAPKAILSEACFKNCKTLKSVYISNVTKIPDYCFFGTAVADVIIPANITSIGEFAYAQSKVKEVVLDMNRNGSKLTVGASAFASCKSLKTVRVQGADNGTARGTWSADTYAFENCTALRSVSLLNATSLGKYIFSGDTALKNVDCNGTIKEVSGETFIGNANSKMPKSYTVNILAGSDGVVKKACQNINGVKIFEVQNFNNMFYVTERLDKGGAVKLSKTTVVSTGTAAKPTVTVTYDGKKLSLNKDYTIGYVGNTDYGTAYVVVEGKGNYSGTITEKFTVIPPKPTGVKVTAESANSIKVTANVNKNTAGIKVTVTKPGSNTVVREEVFYRMMGGTGTSTYGVIDNLAANTQYSVSVRAFCFSDYGSSKADGVTSDAAKPVVVTTAAAGTGVVQSDVEIKQTTKATYTGSVLKPAVKVYYRGTLLKVNRDYTITYPTIKDVGEYEVTVKFKGAYTGTATGTIQVVPKAVTGCKYDSTQYSMQGARMHTITWNTKSIKNPAGLTVVAYADAAHTQEIGRADIASGKMQVPWGQNANTALDIAEAAAKNLAKGKTTKIKLYLVVEAKSGETHKLESKPTTLNCILKGV